MASIEVAENTLTALLYYRLGYGKIYGSWMTLLKHVEAQLIAPLQPIKNTKTELMPTYVSVSWGYVTSSVISVSPWQIAFFRGIMDVALEPSCRISGYGGY